MQVILLERVAKLGQIGDEVSVKDGFARNFLLPRKKALRANAANRKIFEAQRAEIEARNLEAKKEAEQVAEKVDGSTYILIRQASDMGQLYGSVTARDISEAAEAEGVHIARTQVVLNKPLKTLGISEVEVALHPDVMVKVTVNIARSLEEAEAQARGENVLARHDEEETAEDEEAMAPDEAFENPDQAPGGEVADAASDTADDEKSEA